MQFAEHLDLTGSQSPEGVGRAIAALMQDPRLMDLTGQILHVGCPRSRTALLLSLVGGQLGELS